MFMCRALMLAFDLELYWLLINRVAHARWHTHFGA